MKRILIGVLLVILGMSYIVQKELIIKRILAMRDRPGHYIVITEKPKARQPQQEVELMAYPAPKESWPYIPPPDYSHETPLPTPDLSILPTPAPTMNPLGD